MKKSKIESRLNNLTKIIKNLYEDNSSSLIDDETYKELLNNYVSEKKDLQTKLNLIELSYNNQADKIKKLEELKEIITNKKDINKLLNHDLLTSCIVNNIISRIEVGYKEEVKGKITRKITIIYKFVEIEL